MLDDHVAFAVALAKLCGLPEPRVSRPFEKPALVFIWDPTDTAPPKYAGQQINACIVVHQDKLDMLGATNDLLWSLKHEGFDWRTGRFNAG